VLPATSLAAKPTRRQPGARCRGAQYAPPMARRRALLPPRVLAALDRTAFRDQAKIRWFLIAGVLLAASELATRNRYPDEARHVSSLFSVRWHVNTCLCLCQSWVLGFGLGRVLAALWSGRSRCATGCSLTIVSCRTLRSVTGAAECRGSDYVCQTWRPLAAWLLFTLASDRCCPPAALSELARG
jgi:hypothetical protein